MAKGSPRNKGQYIYIYHLILNDLVGFHAPGKPTTHKATGEENDDDESHCFQGTCIHDFGGNGWGDGFFNKQRRKLN